MDNSTFAKYNLAGKTALVTGGGTGIGYSITRALSSLGATVMIASRREEVLKASAEKLMSEPQMGRILYFATDLNSRRRTKELADHAISTLGGVDIFVGNSAQDQLQYIDAMPDGSIDEVIRINLQSNMELTRAFLPRMRKKKWGRIIFSSSVASVCGPAHPGFTVYSASKGGLNAFTRTVAAEAGRDGITANSLVIGLFVTDIVRNTLNKMRATHGDAAVDATVAALTSMIAIGRTGECAEMEGVIQLLATDAGSYITGADITVDGGQSIMFSPNPVVP